MSGSMKLTRPDQVTSKGHQSHALIFVLGFLEFTGAAVAILLISKDPKNAFLFGYSLSRLVLFLFTLCLGIGMLVIAIKTYRKGKSKILEFLTRITPWTDVSFLLFLAGCLVAVIHPSILGVGRYFFERLQPLLLVLCFLPIQFSLTSLVRVKWKFDKLLWFPIFLCFGAILLLTGFIVFTGLGITPDKVYWNVAGMPLSVSQLITILLGVIVSVELVSILKKYIPAQKMKYLDLALCVLIFLTAILVWNKTPFNGHFFTNISWPYYQPFPFSDARDRDLGALSIIIGKSISFNGHTVSPLYEVFLSILHGIADYDYTLLTQLQLIVLAVIPVAIYLFGKAFHNRFLGLLIAAIIIVRQGNAILLSRMIAGSNPFLLTTEMPTYLCISVLVGLIFLWLKKSHKSPWIPFLAGGVLGMAALIRVNPLILFPAALVISLVVMWKSKKKWLGQATVFCLGFLLLITPWILTGTTEDGQSFFLQKFYNVINQRYDPIGQVQDSYGEAILYENASPSRMRMKIANISDIKPDTFINIYQFPGFVVNHFLHNIVTTILPLPDSISPSDQVLTELALRPYWVEQEPWFGELKPSQIIFLFINLALVAMGLGWSWRRWHWAGMIPVFFYLVYLVSMGFARVSGSRYIVPVDWVVFFYYAIGIIMLLEAISKLIKLRIQEELEPAPAVITSTNVGGNNKWGMIFSLVFLISISAIIPVADNFIPEDTLLCQDGSSLPNVSTMMEGNLRNVELVPGRVLYPDIEENTLTFTLLTCQGPMALEIINFDGEIKSGQLVIAVLKYPIGSLDLKILLSYENETPVVLWER